ncbi:MAG: tetratricopeptide repeat protein, partial [Pseudomonadota bacterium]
VAIRRNNLGLAWYSLCQYDKAIEYIEQALPVLIEHLGSEHSNTLLVSSNLESARKALADKAKRYTLI